MFFLGYFTLFSYTTPSKTPVLLRFLSIQIANDSNLTAKSLKCSAFTAEHFFVFIAFQAVLHESAEQTTTRYAGAHQMLYKKFSNLGTIRVFRPYCRRKENFYGESI